MKHLNHPFQNSKPFRNWLKRYPNRDRNMTQKEHIYSICCRPKVAGDIISGQHGEHEGYVVVNFEPSSFGSSQDIGEKNNLVTVADIDDSIKQKCFHVLL